MNNLNSHEGKKTSPKGFWGRLSAGLSKTRQHLIVGLDRLIVSKKALDPELISAIEARLLSADFGVTTTQALIEDLSAHFRHKQILSSQQVFQQLATRLIALLKSYEMPLTLQSKAKPFVLLLVGANGVGKTTTIGKLAYYFQKQHHQVLMAAGDTFRAAAIDQLRVWAERTNTPLIAQQEGADSASVLYDALQSAQARHYDVLIADTAGRLHTASHLLEELKKIIRVLQKLDSTAPHEILLVLDATMGQNILKQANQFQEAVPISGLILTKLDGTAKGGILLAVAQLLQVPIRFIGLGEHLEDLQVFDSEKFVQALLPEAFINSFDGD